MAIYKHHVDALKKLKRCRSVKRRRDLLARGGADLQRVLREICHNVLRGHLRLTARQRTALKKYKKAIRLLASKNTPLKKRLLLEQKGGFIGALVGPLIGSIAASTLGNIASRL